MKLIESHKDPLINYAQIDCSFSREHLPFNSKARVDTLFFSVYDCDCILSFVNTTFSGFKKCRVGNKHRFQGIAVD